MGWAGQGRAANMPVSCTQLQSGRPKHRKACVRVPGFTGMPSLGCFVGIMMQPDATHAPLPPPPTPARPQLYALMMSDEEQSPGGPPRVSRDEIERVLFSREAGWELVWVRPTHIELHPTFWGGKAKGYLAAARKL